ncbi:interferon-induced 35 kDa protein isoform X2 [Elgaria multicarinata webbii]
MDSDEESFIHLPSETIATSGSWETTTEQISWEIKKCQDTCKALEMDWWSLQAAKGASEQDASRLQGQVELLRRRLQECEQKAQEVTYQGTLKFEVEERDQLLQEKQVLESELEQLERLQILQEELHKVPATLPERGMVFKGHVEEEKEGTLPEMLTVLPQIRCPMFGGSALIVFENPEVACRIIAIEQHRVQLDDWTYVHVKAEPLAWLLPSSIEMSLEQSPRQVLLSGLPILSMPEEYLLDKLELFFSKRQNKGGEVQRVERLSTSGHVALSFMEEGVAERLVKRNPFQVPIGKETYEVKLSHCIGGEITDLQFRSSVCARTVLLSGIPDVLDEELMREALEIHFQKPSKGGGEVEAIIYVPTGRCTVAVFQGEED